MVGIDEQVVLKLDHEVEGELLVIRKGDGIRVHMRWPFDLAEDDFVEISEFFTMREWQQAIDAAQDTEEDTLMLQSENGAFLRLGTTGVVSNIEVGSRRGPLSRSIRLTVPISHVPVIRIDD